MNKKMRQSTTPDNIKVISRRPKFDFSDTPKVWLSDPFNTHFMNALSVLIPYSERTVNAIMRKNVGRISDPQLKDEMLALIKQEGAHAAMHQHSNKLLKQCGYTKIDFFEKLQKKSMTMLRRVSSDAFEMAIPAAFEHFTSAISRDFLMHNDKWVGHQSNEAINFAVWHSLEEIEHQAVCYDAYKALYPGRWGLSLALLLFWVPLTVLSTYIVQFYFLHKDRVIYQPKNWVPYLKFLAGNIGLFTKGIFKYRDEKFQPWSESDEALYHSALIQFNAQKSQPST
jgi:predicted metal-dependent hydrolase